MFFLARLKVPLYAKEKAMKALERRALLPPSKRFGFNKRQARVAGVQSGVARAEQLIRDDSIGLSDAKSMALFYSRFKNCLTVRCEGAIDLWGGRRFLKKVLIFVNKNK